MTMTMEAAMGDCLKLMTVPIRFSEFIPDTIEIGNGVVVGQGNWQAQLEANKQAYTLDYVQRSRFMSAYATSMTPAAFVDQMFLNAGVTPSTTDRNAAINEFGSAGNTLFIGCDIATTMCVASVNVFTMPTPPLIRT